MGSASVKAKIPKGTENVELTFIAENLLVAPQKGLQVKITAHLE
jgi:hypothetical protein